MFGSPLNFGAARFLPQMSPQMPQMGMRPNAATMLGLPQLMNQTTVPTPQNYAIPRPQGLIAEPAATPVAPQRGLLAPTEPQRGRFGGRGDGGQGPGRGGGRGLGQGRGRGGGRV